MDPRSEVYSEEYLNAYIGYRPLGVATAMLPIVIIFLALRFYSRHLTRTPWGLDDSLAAMSGVVSVGLSALAICFVKYGGVGRHLAALERETPNMAPQYFKYLLVISTYYYTTVAIPKLAVLALYGRLWTVNPYRTIILILAAVITLTAVVSGVMCLNMCQPFRLNWDTSVPGHCLNKQALYLWASLPNILTDLVMLAMPIPIVYHLNVPMKVKLGLILTFATGLLGLVTSIMRFVIFSEGSAVKDGSWGSTDLMAWSVAEPDIYLISACLPTFRPILNKMFGRAVTTQSSSRYAERYKNSGGSTANSKAHATVLESALYGDEVQLVSVIGKERDSNPEDGLGLGGIYVQRELNVEVSKH
ncbi:hypothetical protein N7466_002757 [Penicillium verhagenii]|uniref:uncharacterized protein n=1 Tax=Penicillium verhagenii TaxID=1562060 RepID=UPI0025456675|nr:uncharacterized protein N7466_002757 [Penicillium verhagenii]KAJ5939623.1 hypothetical protein N7466_002757 [Penicillium verhagenii]